MPTMVSVSPDKCFVAMPYGRKTVKSKLLDFDSIYDDVFRKAIRNVKLEEGGSLRPVRADYLTEQPFPHQTTLFEILTARLVLADITADNPNVMLEIGLRYSTHASGTILVRHAMWHLVPFNLSIVNVLPYDHKPAEKAEESRRVITKTLKGRLKTLVRDSPFFAGVEQVLQRMRAPDGAELRVRVGDAWRAIREGDIRSGIESLEAAAELERSNPSLQQMIGALYRTEGADEVAAKHFQLAARLAPDYADAERESGLAQLSLYKKDLDLRHLATAEAALKRAVAIDPHEPSTTEALADLFRDQGLLDPAREQLEKVNASLPGHREFRKKLDLVRKLSERRLRWLPLDVVTEVEQPTLHFTLRNAAPEVEKAEVVGLFSRYGYVDIQQEQVVAGGGSVARLFGGTLELKNPKMLGRMVKELDHHEVLGGLVAIGLGGPGLASDWVPKSRALGNRAASMNPIGVLRHK